MKENFNSKRAVAEETMPRPIKSSPDLAKLYRAIMQFRIGDEGSKLPFHARLAKENGWRNDYARRVEFEYKRFIFLAVASGHPVSPSDHVDQAWHLHLMYTRSYWCGLCRDVLGMPLHHTPSRGGPAEVRKFDYWHLATIMSYEKMFGVTPSEDIWPSVKNGFERFAVFRKLKIREHWLIRKTLFLSRAVEKFRKLEIQMLFTTALLVLVGIFNQVHAAKGNISGSIFDGLIGLLTFVALVWLLIHILYYKQVCPACGKWHTVKKTGNREKRELDNTMLEEWKCSACGNVTWKNEPTQCG